MSARRPQSSQRDQPLVILIHLERERSVMEEDIVRGLTNAGHVARVVRNLNQAADEAAARWIDLAVCICDTGQPPPLVRWLATSQPSLPCVLFAGRWQEILRPLSQGLKNLVCMAGDLDLQRLLAEVERVGPRHGFVTQAVELELFDYLQLVAINGADKVVEVRTPLGPATFWFERGAMVHARYGEREGEDAFFAVVGSGAGTFRETIYAAAPKQSIVRSSTHLLMEASRLLDEGALPPTDASLLTQGSAPGEWARWDDLEGSGKPRGHALHLVDSAAIDEALDDWADLTIDDEPSKSPPHSSGQRSSRSSLHSSINSHAEVDFSFSPRVSEENGRRQGQPVPESRTNAKSGSAIRVDPRRDELDDADDLHVTTEGPLMEALIEEDDEVRRVLVEQFFAEPGVVGVAILNHDGSTLVSELGTYEVYQQRAHALVKAAARLSPALSARHCESMVVRSGTQSHLVVACMGRAWVTLVVEPMADPDEVRDRVLGIGP